MNAPRGIWIDPYGKVVKYDASEHDVAAEEILDEIDPGWRDNDADIPNDIPMSNYLLLEQGWIRESPGFFQVFDIESSKDSLIERLSRSNGKVEIDDLDGVIFSGSSKDAIEFVEGSRQTHKKRRRSSISKSGIGWRKSRM